MEMELTTIRGGCLCGAIRYEGIGEPHNVTHCHCEDCRKSAGAPFATWDLIVAGFATAEARSFYEYLNVPE